MDTPNSTSNVPLKQCSRKEKCVNPLGSWLPATLEYFERRGDGLRGTCRVRADCSHENGVTRHQGGVDLHFVCGSERG